MDDSTLAAIERLRALGAVDVLIAADKVHVRFEPVHGGELPIGDEPLDEIDAQKAHEDLLYHSS